MPWDQIRNLVPELRIWKLIWTNPVFLQIKMLTL